MKTRIAVRGASLVLVAASAVLTSLPAETGRTVNDGATAARTAQAWYKVIPGYNRVWRSGGPPAQAIA